MGIPHDSKQDDNALKANPERTVRVATTVCATKTLGQADRAAAAQGINGVGVIAKRGEDFAAEFADQRRMEQGAAFARGAMPGMLASGKTCQEQVKRAHGALAVSNLECFEIFGYRSVNDRVQYSLGWLIHPNPAFS